MVHERHLDGGKYDDQSFGGFMEGNGGIGNTWHAWKDRPSTDLWRRRCMPYICYIDLYYIHI